MRYSALWIPIYCNVLINTVSFAAQNSITHEWLNAQEKNPQPNKILQKLLPITPEIAVMLMSPPQYLITPQNPNPDFFHKQIVHIILQRRHTIIYYTHEHEYPVLQNAYILLATATGFLSLAGVNTILGYIATIPLPWETLPSPHLWLPTRDILTTALEIQVAPGPQYPDERRAFLMAIINGAYKERYSYMPDLITPKIVTKVLPSLVGQHLAPEVHTADELYLHTATLTVQQDSQPLPGVESEPNGQIPDTQ